MNRDTKKLIKDFNKVAFTQWQVALCKLLTGDNKTKYNTCMNMLKANEGELMEDIIKYKSYLR